MPSTYAFTLIQNLVENITGKRPFLLQVETAVKICILEVFKHFGNKQTCLVCLNYTICSLFVTSFLNTKPLLLLVLI